MVFETGQAVGDYEIIDVIESSQACTTYKVRNRRTCRFEALKVLPRSAQDDSVRVERFVREMKLLARLVHPNIIGFCNSMRIEGHCFMTTELVEGTTLEGLIEIGLKPWKEAVRLMTPVLDALEYAHANGIIHREVKPSNVLVTAAGEIKLTGFALAKSAADGQLTQFGCPLGSVWYMSPEQVKGVAAVTPATDIYSAGIVLYELIAGQKPFPSMSQFEVMSAHVNTDPAPPSRFIPGIPEELDRIVLKALSKEPAERFESAHSFCAALRTLDSGEFARATPEEPQPAHDADKPAPPAAIDWQRLAETFASSNVFTAALFILAGSLLVITAIAGGR